jgi:mRNA (2'-O-methyladenosine-N6-)-methyltransferase
VGTVWDTPASWRLTFDSPRYLHFQVSPSTSKHFEYPPEGSPPPLAPAISSRLLGDDHSNGAAEAAQIAQWVNCDVRSFDYSVLGQ